MNDDRLFGPKIDHQECANESDNGIADGFINRRDIVDSNISSDTTAMESKKESPNSNGEPKRLSIELPAELHGVDRPRKRSSWLSEMCLGKETKLNDKELTSYTPSSSFSGPDGKSAGRAGGVGSRLRASIFSVLGKLGTSLIVQGFPSVLILTLPPTPMYVPARVGCLW